MLWLFFINIFFPPPPPPPVMASAEICSEWWLYWEPLWWLSPLGKSLWTGFGLGSCHGWRSPCLCRTAHWKRGNNSTWRLWIIGQKELIWATCSSVTHACMLQKYTSDHRRNRYRSWYNIHIYFMNRFIDSIACSDSNALFTNWFLYQCMVQIIQRTFMILNAYFELGARIRKSIICLAIYGNWCMAAPKGKRMHVKTTDGYWR